MHRFTLAIVLVLALATAFAAQVSGQAPAQPSAAEFAAAAAELPPIPRHDGALELPLTPGAESGTDNAWGWHPIRPEIGLADADGALAARYQVATGQPAGAALLVPAGTFTGDDTLVIRATAERNVQLLITLQTDDGAVFSLPSLALRPGNPRTYERPLADATYFAPQSSAPDPGTFDPARVVSVTLLDIAGFMGPATPEVSWTVESVEARGEVAR